MNKKLIRFDWAIKKLLRHKANFTILEGFLTELLKFDVVVVDILESEGNKEDAADKYNRVDILVKSSKGELMLVEVQNESQTDYFQRMVFGASKLITEHIQEGSPYSQIKKVYSINVIYFGLGQGKDYIYEYDGKFVGVHLGDVLQPTQFQKEAFRVEEIRDIFPKYYLLKVNNFDDVAKDTLDEWIYFLKNSEIQSGFKAKGLKEASEKLKEDMLSEEERYAYRRFQKNRRIERSVMETAWKEAEYKGMEKGIEKGIEKGMEKGMEITLEVYRMHKEGKMVEDIAQAVGLSIVEVETMVEKF